MGMFKRGYNPVREEKQRQDENREKMGKQLWRMYISKDGEEAQVRFLTEEPINFYEHTLKSTRNGKETYDNEICVGDDCPYCESGDKPSFKGAFLVVDKRPYEYKDKNGKKQTGNARVKLYVQGTRILSQLDRLSERYGLTSRDYIITRSGSGTSTSYMFDRTDDTGKMTESEIKNLLPDKIRDDYDGTMESLYGIVQNQLEMSVSGMEDSSNSDEDDNDDDDGSDNSNLVGVEDTSSREARGRSASNKPSLKKSMFKKK